MTRNSGLPSLRLLSGVSLFTVCTVLGGLSAQAQTQTPDAGAVSGTSVDEIVVTAQRAALEAAEARKENADQILDSITAEDAGKLPDSSISEVLQRVPGVSITYFEAINDPDHFSAQGSGIVVRGLSQVSSVLNGQQSFSATGGRGLLWEDVTPELFSAVDVFKSPTADQIEGGIGGQIDLRTKMPFDFKKETFSVTTTGEYADFRHVAHPGGSALYANNWQTGAGKFGVVVDLAYSDLSTKDDFIRNEPYYPQTAASTQSALGTASVPSNGTYYIPGGFDFGEDEHDVVRLGAYEATQWAPNSSLTLYQTFFRSDYWDSGYGFGVFNAADYGEVPGVGSVNTFGSGNQLLSSNNMVCDNCNAPQGTFTAKGPGDIETDSAYNWGHNETTDLSEGFKWKPNDRMQVKSAFQYVESASGSGSINLYLNAFYPTYQITEPTGDGSKGFPVISTNSAGSTNIANPANYWMQAGMDHIENHVGKLFAYNADTDYALSDDSFLRSVKVGLRLADQTEKDAIDGYNWSGVNPTWDWEWSGTGNPTYTPATVGTQYIQSNTLANFFRGQTPLPGAAIFFSDAALRAYPGNYAALTKLFGGALTPESFETMPPNDISYVETKTAAAYAMARFDDEHSPLFGWAFNGNIGGRYVYNDNASRGYESGPQGAQITVNGASETLPNVYVANNGGRDTGVFLPSLNFQFLPTDDIHLRFAAAQSMTNPSFSNLSASGTLSLITNTEHEVTGATATTGNPSLKPQIANDLDFSAEYYMPTGGQVHFATFYKEIKDYLSYGATGQYNTYYLPGLVPQKIFAADSEEYNGSPARIKGAEIGLQKFFDFLPDPFKGLGIDTNFTYLLSSAPGDLAYDMLGNKITGLPVDTLSRYNYNITGMYEKGPLSLRVAYSWRSKYLLAVDTNGTEGTYTNSAGQNVLYSLPVFADDFGEIDASLTYKISKSVEFSLQGNNLSDSVQRTLMGVGAQQFVRSWFIQDRRYSGVLRMTF